MDTGDRLARFEREAELLAALNHPNIAAIYGMEESAGTTALVLELVEGPTLADRLVDGPLALSDAIAISRQIIDALGWTLIVFASRTRRLWRPLRQRIDRSRGTPVGEPFIVQHLHDPTRRWGSTPFGNAIVSNAFVFTQVEMTGSIWLLEPESVQTTPAVVSGFPGHRSGSSEMPPLNR